MHERYPRMRLQLHQSGELGWEGALEPFPGARFRVSLSYPANYPFAEPVARVLEPPLRAGAPHVYQNGSLCIHRQGETWNASKHTAASRVPLIASWLVAYMHWTQTGERF